MKSSAEDESLINPCYSRLLKCDVLRNFKLTVVEGI